MGNGFLGTPASLMLDVVTVSLIVLLPVLVWSIWLVRCRKRYLLHERLQTALFLTLFTVVVLFEIDMRLQGGFWTMAKDSPYAGTAFLRGLLVVHLIFSISTVVLWFVTFWTAIWKFGKPPRPNRFSPKHKVLAWFAVGDMVGTVVTGLMVYYYGFWVTP